MRGPLTELERQTLAALVQYGTNKAAARALGTTEQNISSRRCHIARAFGGNFLAAVAAWGAATQTPDHGGDHPSAARRSSAGSAVVRAGGLEAAP